MIPTPMERVESLRIGTVEFVSPNEIKVSLEIEAPESIALNAEMPRPFPRINSYMLIPSDDGYLVGQVEWMVVERSPYPKRRGMKDFGLVDLPYPLRKMSLNPVGTLTKTGAEKARYRFRRGTDAFPSVGDAVLLPTQEQLRSVVESGDNRRIKIGTSPLAGDADVRVDPDRLFGRHLAVLGNTGSGKSCSVAGLIRWSLEAARKESKKIPNARFIVLDPNGEYSRAFSANSDSIKPRLFKVDSREGSSDTCLQVPLWFWNSAELMNVSDYVETMMIRIRTMLADNRMKSIITGDKDISLDQWLTDYIGGNQPEQGNLTIIDLSLVPSEIVHIVTAVIARMVFEALQRYRKLHDEHKVLPTVLVMEEAHTFVKRYKEESENQTAAAICCQVFERIAREGRKFGLGLVLSSQRPSELSPTVLSQCNTFLIHRISNDKDQELIHRFVPDNLKGLLRDLPVLSSQNAILLGWASELPVLVRMKDLPVDQQPQSDDPDFWNVWSGACDRSINWKNIADDWQQMGSQNSKKKILRKS